MDEPTAEEQRTNSGRENLRPYPPGVSGNPGGRPKGRSLTARLRDLLEAHELGGKPIPDGKQVADLVAEAIVERAAKGDYRFISLIADRTEGRPVQGVELSGRGGGPIELTSEVMHRAERELSEWRDRMRREMPSGK